MRLSGRFGRFGGCYVPEILVPALEQLEAAFLAGEPDLRAVFTEERQAGRALERQLQLAGMDHPDADENDETSGSGEEE